MSLGDTEVSVSNSSFVGNSAELAGKVILISGPQHLDISQTSISDSGEATIPVIEGTIQATGGLPSVSVSNSVILDSHSFRVFAGFTETDLSHVSLFAAGQVADADSVLTVQGSYLESTALLCAGSSASGPFNYFTDFSCITAGGGNAVGSALDFLIQQEGIHTVARPIVEDLIDFVPVSECSVSVDLVGADRPSGCLLYTSPSPRDRTRSRMPSSA